ncbi:hypothetical protein NEOLEDRAFT_313365 [Neolentinus lepideus HHB14362 ss-1]|uniref:Uncharacterized protein n=1 Tax=Neolentinus lepideus HHB14362 ss-1 TaxID=1314782 RepID=A0A165VT84_9AGAM|nr:hypothetical protein NEOLEDRAFT_313365 [Neolentinus lepideus HHB14362 ss-1]
MASVIVYRAVLHVRTCRTMDVPTSWGYGGRLLVTLLRDSIQYYTWIVLAFLVEIIAGSKFSPERVKGLNLFPFIAVIPTSAATHMILHLHRVAVTSRQRSISIELVSIRHSGGIQKGTDVLVLEEGQTGIKA